MYMLDTNTLIYFFKGMGNVAHHLLHETPQNIGIPSLVLFELQVGIAKSASPKKRTAQLKEMTSIVTVFPLGEKEAGESAMIRASLERKGTMIGPYDVLIAGTALANNAKLVTHNVREFERVEGLSLEDWY